MDRTDTSPSLRVKEIKSNLESSSKSPRVIVERPVIVQRRGLFVTESKCYLNCTRSFGETWYIEYLYSSTLLKTIHCHPIQSQSLEFSIMFFDSYLVKTSVDQISISPPLFSNQRVSSRGNKHQRDWFATGMNERTHFREIAGRPKKV